MRKIDKLASDAFLNGEEFRLSNTEVKIENDFVILYLHGNAIARRHVNTIIPFDVSLGGYPVSMTTNSRLSALPNVSASIRKGEAHLNGEPWDGNWVSVAGGRK